MKKKNSMEYLAIIDHDTHTLYIEEVTASKIQEYGGEQEYIDALYGVGNYSWDYIVEGCFYYPELEENEPIEINFEQLKD